MVVSKSYILITRILIISYSDFVYNQQDYVQTNLNHSSENFTKLRQFFKKHPIKVACKFQSTQNQNKNPRRSLPKGYRIRETRDRPQRRKECRSNQPSTHPPTNFDIVCTTVVNPFYYQRNSFRSDNSRTTITQNGEYGQHQNGSKQV